MLQLTKDAERSLTLVRDERTKLQNTICKNALAYCADKSEYQYTVRFAFLQTIEYLLDGSKPKIRTWMSGNHKGPMTMDQLEEWRLGMLDKLSTYQLPSGNDDQAKRYFIAFQLFYNMRIE